MAEERSEAGTDGGQSAREAVAARAALVEAGRLKPAAPYRLDEQMTFFCPQENLDGYQLPLVQSFLQWAREEYEPPAVDEPAIMLLLPCQARKPYPLSSEHLAINSRLLAEGFEPDGPGDPPADLDLTPPPGFAGETTVDGLLPSQLISNAPLRGHGVRIDRVVVSEPFAWVPYEAVYHWRGDLTPCARYDDPGLFEERGIDPVWREDCTTVGGRWGDSEWAAYAEMHRLMARQLHAVIDRLDHHYEAVVSYVAPTLTHRTFLCDRLERMASGVATDAIVAGERRPLVGVNDLTPGLVEIVPSGEQLRALAALDPSSAPQNSGEATVLRRADPGEFDPFALPADLLERPETLDLLITTLRDR